MIKECPTQFALEVASSAFWWFSRYGFSRSELAQRKDWLDSRGTSFPTRPFPQFRSTVMGAPAYPPSPGPQGEHCPPGPEAVPRPALPAWTHPPCPKLRGGSGFCLPSFRCPHELYLHLCVAQVGCVLVLLHEVSNHKGTHPLSL